MRWIQKQDLPPASISTFLAANLPLGVNLDYQNGFGRKAQLCEELQAEQHYLCGYTGVPLDPAWLGEKQTGSGLLFRPHNEHIKTQECCKQELIDDHKVPGSDLGDDMNHRNIIAALEVKCDGKTKESERFGAVVRKLAIIPLPPTDQSCSTSYVYLDTGKMRGASSAANDTIDDLRLKHTTLESWRRGAIDGRLPLKEATPPEELRQIIRDMETPTNGRLPDFAFVIAQLARDYLAMHELRAAKEN